MHAAVFFCLSGATNVSYTVYDALMGLESIWLYVLGSGLFAALCLHAMDWYSWGPRWKALLGVIVTYVVLIGCACNAKNYPSAPGLVVMSQCPLLLGLLRYHSAAYLRVCAYSFFR